MSQEKNLTVEEFNSLLDEIDYSKPEITVSKCTVSFTFSGIKYNCSLTGEKKHVPNCGNIWGQFCKFTNRSFELKDKEKYGYIKVDLKDHATKVHWKLKDPGNYWYVKESASRQWLKCYSYDINSAYSYAMLQPLPDTSVEPRLNCILKEGEIGFYNEGSATKEVGAYVEYAFPLKIYNFDIYINRYYEKKKLSKGELRKLWKEFLNIPAGMMQKNNIFIRLGILYNAAEYIKQFQDEDTVYCNTDSIVSLKRRTDLPIGNEIGQFKEEHVNEDFKFIKAGQYQWGNECHYTGVPGCAIKDIENIEGWQENLPYKLVNRRIVKNG